MKARIICSIGLAAGMVVMNAYAETPPADHSANPHQMLGSGANPRSMAAAEGANPHGMNGFAVGDRKDITWTLPKGWSELPPTSMRLGNFTAIGSNGNKAEIIVAALPGSAGGVAANISMWRSQLGLPQIPEEDILKQSEKIKVAGLDMTSIELVSNDNVVDNKAKARIVGVICTHGTNTWFFKMKGEDKAVTSLKGAFQTFLSSIKFSEAGQNKV